MEKGIVWHVTNHNCSTRVRSADSLLDKGFFPYQDIEKLITEYHKKNAIMLAINAKTAMPKLHGSSAHSHSAQTERQIKVYNSAGKADQKTFRIWLIEEEMRYHGRHLHK
ncbi:MAG: hypothetical protein ACJAZP_000743 [Psychromonas sp.]|uniref:DUF2057 family protein n=1 Tax=Psychromonas sp. TaxID=1884585 RepID=UPI0039E3B85E